VMVSGSQRVTDEMFFVAAQTLAAEVSTEDLKHDSVYPPLSKIREVSARVAAAVAALAQARHLATQPKADDLAARIKSQMYESHIRPTCSGQGLLRWFVPDNCKTPGLVVKPRRGPGSCFNSGQDRISGNRRLRKMSNAASFINGLQYG